LLLLVPHQVLQRWGTVAGTGRYGPEVDMWSVGVILHVVLTGRNPFNDESTMWQQIAEAQ
jgi:serine/threonine protein kinase